MTFRTILITGASAGIGAALAEHLAAPGITLFLGGRDVSALEAVAGRCRSRGAEALTCAVDVTHQAAMSDWIAASDRRAPLDLVIANAGISGGTSDHAEEVAQARRIVEVNLLGVMNTVFPILPAMRGRQKGTIAIVSSLASFRGLPGSSAYGASKAAVRVWAETLDAENAPFGLRVVAVCPGFITTRMTARNNFYMPGLMDAGRAAAIIVRGLERGRRRIAFPLQTYTLLRALNLLPFGWGQSILARKPPGAG